MDEVEGTPERTPDELIREAADYFGKNRPRLRRVARRAATDADDASTDDIVTDAFMELHKYIRGVPTADPPAPPRPVPNVPAYSIVFVRRAAKNWGRKRGRERSRHVPLDVTVLDESQLAVGGSDIDVDVDDATGRASRRGVFRMLVNALEHDDVATVHEVIGDLHDLCTRLDPELGNCLEEARPSPSELLVFLLTRFPMNDDVAASALLDDQSGLEDDMVAALQRTLPGALQQRSPKKDDLMPTIAAASLRLLNPRTRAGDKQYWTRSFVHSLRKRMTSPQCESCIEGYSGRDTTGTKHEKAGS